jgi:adenosylcobinamide-phosphate synthase
MMINFHWYILPTAFLLDLILGDPVYLPHPIRWMGRAITDLEAAFRKIPATPLISGAMFAVALIFGTWLTTLLVVSAASRLNSALGAIVEIVCIYYCISARSLEDAAMKIQRHLVGQRVCEARADVALIVGRDVADYGERDIARATVESVAENLVDGVIAPLFFAALGGAPLAMAYKMANTLDSMVGYKNEKYLLFGKAAARIDDFLNYLPARLSVPVISLATHVTSGSGLRSLRTAFDEGSNHASPNAGYPEAAFAGALAVKLNGPNYYGGQRVDKPYLGVNFGETTTLHIKKACDIMILSSFLWLLVVWAARVAF